MSSTWLLHVSASFVLCCLASCRQLSTEMSHTKCSGERNERCGLKCFNPMLEICCNGTIHRIQRDTICCLHTHLYIRQYPYVDQCCGSQKYDPRRAVCCGADTQPPDRVTVVAVPGHPDNYSCCADGRAVASGETCDAVDYCNTVPFSPRTHVCCGGKLTALGSDVSSRVCCNGKLIDPLREVCCYDQYSISRISDITCCANAPEGYVNNTTHVCCAGTPHEANYTADELSSSDVGIAGSVCCGRNLRGTSSDRGCCPSLDGATAELFNASTHHCCGGKVYPKSTRCCASKWSLTSTQVCCDRTGPLDAAADSSADSCCEDRFSSRRLAYNHTTQICRHGRVWTREPRQCGQQSYDRNVELCCQGVVNANIGGHRRCCLPGNRAFDPRYQTCCSGQVFDGMPQRLFGCAHGRPQSNVPKCRAPFESLCGGTCFSGSRQFCCEDAASGLSKLHVRRRGGNDSCCGVRSYDAATQLCCDGEVGERRTVDRAMTKCCGKVGYNARRKYCLPSSRQLVDVVCTAAVGRVATNRLPNLRRMCLQKKRQFIVFRARLKKIVDHDGEPALQLFKFGHIERQFVCRQPNVSTSFDASGRPPMSRKRIVVATASSRCRRHPLSRPSVDSEFLIVVYGKLTDSTTDYYLTRRDLVFKYRSGLLRLMT